MLETGLSSDMLDEMYNVSRVEDVDLNNITFLDIYFKYNYKAGVAELGGPGGPWPPQKFEWVGQGMFWPPQNFDHWPPQNGPPVVKIFAKLLLNILKCAKFSKIFACGGLIWVELIPQVILCFFRAYSFTF